MIDGYIKITSEDTRFYCLLEKVIEADPQMDHEFTQQANQWKQVFELKRSFYVVAAWAKALFELPWCTDGQVCTSPD